MCHDAGLGIQPDDSARRRFLSAPYIVDKAGRARPSDGINQCPRASGSERCRIRQHDWRNRKTGPSVALRVLKCMTHSRAFTVYPPGYVPYGRQAWIAVDLRGDAVKEPEREDDRFEGCEFRGFGGREAGKALAKRASRGSSAGKLLDPAAENRTSGMSSRFSHGGFVGSG